MDVLPVTVFSDFGCPYSYVTESALRRSAGSDVRVEYRAFELYPEADTGRLPAIAADQWETALELAEAEGIPLSPIEFRPRTRKAHEASRFARLHDCEIALRKEIYSAFWSEGRDIGRIDVLMEVAERVGLEPEDLKIALDIDQFTEAVAHDLSVAQRLRIPGSPTIFLGSGPTAQVIVGAQNARQLRSLLHEASRDWQDSNEDV